MSADIAHFFELYHRHPSRALRLILDSGSVLRACQPNALLEQSEPLI